MTDTTASPPVAPEGLFSLDGRTAVVTGASSGLGARFACVLAMAGATVYATARRADRLDALAEGALRICPVPCDLTQESERVRLVGHVLEHAPQIDILVNNAGVSGSTDAREEDSTSFAAVQNINLVAPFHLACLAADAVLDQGDLSIVNVASILGLVSAAPLAGASYAASKAGLIGLTRELAGQWGRRRVRVNALAPGWFRSEMTEQLFVDPMSHRWVERNTMLARGGDVHELDGALLFLASAASTYCTGQVITIDGGWTAR
jgi:NAD(P)-dependent dehydrogenase (short-subunit alcohol dehydrogenase family)